MKFIKQKVEATGSSSQRLVKSILDGEITEKISPSPTGLPEQRHRAGSTPTHNIVGTFLHTNKDKGGSRRMGKKIFFWTSESDRYSLIDYPYSYILKEFSYTYNDLKFSMMLGA